MLVREWEIEKSGALRRGGAAIIMLITHLKLDQCAVRMFESI
jgi:hypothetical protein